MFDDVIGIVVKTFLAIAAGMITWLFKRQSDHAREIERLKASIVNEDKIRAIVTESWDINLRPLSEDIKELKHITIAQTDAIKELELGMAKEQGRREAMEAAKQEMLMEANRM